MGRDPPRFGPTPRASHDTASDKTLSRDWGPTAYKHRAGPRSPSGALEGLLARPPLAPAPPTPRHPPLPPETDPLDFLLETIGFPPDWCGSSILQRFGTSVTTRRGGPLRLAGGLEVHPDRDLGPASEGTASIEPPSDLFWPGYSGGRIQRLRADRIERVAASPHQLSLTGRVLSEDDSFRRGPGTPVHALLHPESGPENLETRSGRLLDVRLSAFAIEVTSISPAAQEHRLTPERAPQGSSARITPLQTPDAPVGCCELDLAVSAVHVLSNPLTGCAVDLIEAVPPWSSFDSQSVASPLALFVSPWQLAEDRLERLAPGDRVRGTFLLVARS